MRSQQTFAEGRLAPSSLSRLEIQEGRAPVPALALSTGRPRQIPAGPLTTSVPLPCFAPLSQCHHLTLGTVVSVSPPSISLMRTGLFLSPSELCSRAWNGSWHIADALYCKECIVCALMKGPGGTEGQVSLVGSLPWCVRESGQGTKVGHRRVSHSHQEHPGHGAPRAQYQQTPLSDD